jgi:hypothetical protein
VAGRREELVLREIETWCGKYLASADYGRTATKVPNFAAEEIPSFAVSHDGRLAIERRNSSSDVVLIRNFR